MTEQEYQKAMEHFTPDPGLRARTQAAVERGERSPARVRPLRTVLVAAAVCFALVGTAFAASPGLRDLLSEALGGFAPYAQKQDGGTQTWNGFEFKVLSALADENMLRVYVQARDLEGRGRLDIHGDTWLQECPMFSVAGVKSSVETTGGSASATYNHYDETTQTAVVVCTRWDAGMEDLAGAELRVDTVRNMMDDSQNAAVKIPLRVEVTDSRAILRNIEVDGAQVEELRLSPLSVTAVTRREGDYTRSSLDAVFRVRLKDGTEVKTEYDHVSGHGVYKASGGGYELDTLSWNLADPVELDQVAGVYVGEEYYPIK